MGVSKARVSGSRCRWRRRRTRRRVSKTRVPIRWCMPRSKRRRMRAVPPTFAPMIELSARPVLKPTPPPTPKPKPKPPPPPSTRCPNPMSDPSTTVVLIEDEKQIRRFVRTALEGEGIVVHDAETGKQGLVEAATRKPDLVIVDLGLPDTDGLDVIRELRGWSELPVIVLSARTQESEKVAALDAGADDYLTKPFGVSELLARIRAQMRRR